MLIADDLAMNRKLLLRVFKKIISSPVQYIEVATAEKAIEAAGERCFSLIVMDQTFSEEEGALCGTDAVREIRRAEDFNGSSRAVIVACTGYAELAAGDGGGAGSVNDFFVGAGCNAVWGKPIPSHIDGSMQREIRRLLSHRS